jgi:hypothetical protein
VANKTNVGRRTPHSKTRTGWGLSRRNACGGVPCEKAVKKSDHQTGNPRRLSPAPVCDENQAKSYSNLSTSIRALSFDRVHIKMLKGRTGGPRGCHQYDRCWLGSALCAWGERCSMVVRHTGESATEDVKLLNLCRLLVTVDGVAISEVPTTVGDGCGSRATFCDDN